MKLKPPCEIVDPARAQRGMMAALLVALLFSVTITALFALTGAHAGFFQAINAERRVQASYMAEAGLNLAIVRLRKLGSLEGLSLPYEAVPYTLLGDGSFQVELVNNGGDADPAVDTDGVFVLRATGWSTGEQRRRIIESYVTVVPGELALPGVLTVCDGMTASFSGGPNVSGYDASQPGVSVAGVAYETPGQSVTMSSTATVTGTPDYSWASSAFTTDGFSAQARDLIDSLSTDPAAIHLSSTATTTFGTTSAPQITVVDAGRVLQLSQPVTGSGVLIIRGTLFSNYGFTFDGLILIEGDAGYLSTNNNMHVVGAVVITPPQAPTGTTRRALQCSGNNTIDYSRSSADLFAAGDPTLAVHSFTYQN